MARAARQTKGAAPMPQPLTPMMRAALEEASRRIEGLRRTFDDTPGQPAWPFAPPTLAALVRRELLEPREVRHRKGWRVQAWFITDAGKEALKPVLRVVRDQPLYMAPGGGYTTNPKRSVDMDETVDLKGRTVLVAVEAVKGAPSPEWAQRAERHRRLARADADAARLSGLDSLEDRVAEWKRMAAERRKDIRGDLRQLEHVVRRIERKVSEDEKAA